MVPATLQPAGRTPTAGTAIPGQRNVPKVAPVNTNRCPLACRAAQVGVPGTQPPTGSPQQHHSRPVARAAAAAAVEAPPRAPPAAAPAPPRPSPPPPVNHPVMHLLASRALAGPGGAAGVPGAPRPDGAKLGLVVEGGGMRGICTGAMLMGLQEAGLSHVFDAVYGASAGAINSTFFLSGQPEGLDIYTDHLALGSRFLSLRRYWSRTGCPAMDLDYLIDDVMGPAGVVPLDWDAVLASPLPLKVVASSLTSLRAEVLDDFVDAADLAECLKASANVPEIVGGPRSHRGHELVDAAVFEPLPVKAALRDGCTHVLALCSRPPSAGPTWGRYLSGALATAVKLTLLNPPYMREAWRAEPRHSTHRGQHIDDLLHGSALGGTPLELQEAAICSSADGLSDGSDGAAVEAAERLLGGHVLPVYPSTAASFAPICTHVPTLVAGRAAGYEAVAQMLGVLAAAVAARAPLQ